jgi:hypothetical protein
MLRLGNPDRMQDVVFRSWPMLRVRIQYGGATIAAACWLAIAGTFVHAEPAFRRPFNGPETTWQLMSTGVQAQILAQACAAGGARDNSGFERVLLAVPAGQSAHLVCPVPAIAVLDEFQARLWVNSNRPDIQLAARVVMPRSIDPQGKTPATTIVRGAIYNRPGHWQELRLAETPKLLAEQVRVMRATPGASIDPREAYVDAVVLIVPGNSAQVEIGTDELEVDGVMLSKANPQAAANAATPANAGGAAVKKPTVRLHGTTLTIDDKPFLPRIIQSNGEPLELLSKCGFNVVQLPGAPTPEQSAQAERLGMWFLAAPEHPDNLTRTTIGRPGDRVLAWFLKDDALEVDPGYSMRWAELVRERDAVFGRPIVIMPESNWSAVNKSADILVAKKARIGMIAPADFDYWLDGCPAKAQPGTPIWVTIATQFDGEIREQVNALKHAAAPAIPVDGQQLETFVRIACAHGMRGYLFQSSSSLAENDEFTKRRIANLRLINQRLQLIEPWLAAGKVVDRVDSLDRWHTGIMLHVDRARLMVQLANESEIRVRIGNQPTQHANDEIVYTVPGIPESSQIFYMSPAAMRSLLSQRIAGGTRFTVPPGGDGFILITEDPQVIYNLRRRISRDGPTLVQMERELTTQRARSFAETSQKLIQLGYNADLAAREVTKINQQVGQLESFIASGQMEQAYDTAAVAMRNLDKAAREQRKAILGPVAWTSNPLSVSFDMFPEFAELQRSVASMHGDNLLAGGDFEDLTMMSRLGWQHLGIKAENVDASAQLSSKIPQHGTYCLELSASARQGTHPPTGAGDLVSIISPPVAANPNQVIEISGWVRIDDPFVGGDGLEIRDSLGGPPLSLVVDKTSGWQFFRMIRSATAPTELRITFSISGLGTAKLDAVMVRAFGQPVARRLPAAEPANQFSASNSPAAPSFAAPQTR